ncbi:MAG: hypothetical protein JWO12_470 [Frankiales bacterium]|nr:hypothetical protein [Frankiales bacterium]
MRDAMLLEGGCCLAEALGGNCLLLTGWLLPALLSLFTRTAGNRDFHHTPGGGSRSQRVLLAAIGRYQRTVSVRRPHPVCRFTPSCSSYAVEAITSCGAVGGTRRAVGRLLRCRPGSAGGYDPFDATTSRRLPA